MITLDTDVRKDERPDDLAANDIPRSLKSNLEDDDGIPYREFRRGLTPRWWRVWLELGTAYAILGGVLVSLIILDPGFPLAVLAVAVGAIVIGYVLQFVNNFFHEAAHWNLVPGRFRNDLIANLLMAWLFAESIASFRHHHLQHHRALGTTADYETAYFDALRVRKLVEGLLGLSVIRTVRRWHWGQQREHQRADPEAQRALGARLAWIALAGMINGGLVVLLIYLGSSTAALAWLLGLVVIFPFLASVRALLEHRSEDAEADVDYFAQDHGAVNRLFGDGPLASTLGSAGFNRHAIHHWEPTVSYTRLKDIEAYLLRSPAAPLIRDRQTTYRDTFLRLLEL